MNSNFREKLQSMVALIGPIVLLTPIVYVASLLISDTTDEDYIDFVLRNYLTFFGMPYAAFFAYYLVVTIESGRGPIELEFGGLKFRGAAGPLIFWVLIFLSILLGFKLFWVGWGSE
jgi:hypothetical protein